MATKVKKPPVKRAKRKAQEVPLKAITCDPRCQTRGELDQEHIDGMVDALEDGRELAGEKPVVFFDSATKTYYVGDGFHRYEAYAKAKFKTMPCEVRKGTVEDAIEYAHRDANATNALKLPKDAIKRKVEWHLEHEKYRYFTDGQIGKWCHCSREFVGLTRCHCQVLDSDIPPEWLQPDLKKTWLKVVGDPEKPGVPRLGFNKHGELAVINVANIGKAQSAPAGTIPVPSVAAAAEDADREASRVDRIKAKIEKYKDTPVDRANRLIAQEEKVSVEAVRNVRQSGSPTPQGGEGDEEKTAKGKKGQPARQDKGDGANGHQKPTPGRGLNKGHSCLGETQLAEWSDRLDSFCNAFKSWVPWNPWLDFQIQMDATLPFRSLEAMYAQLEGMKRLVFNAKPDNACPACDGVGCMACHGCGFMPDAEYGEYLATHRGRK